MEELTPLRIKRRNNLLEIAEDFFIENGLHTSTMEDIASASGISRQTVYRYYGSKEEIAFAVELRVLKRIFTRLEELFTAANGLGMESIYEMSSELISSFVVEYERELKFTGVFDTYFQQYPNSSFYEEMKAVLKDFENPFTSMIKFEVEHNHIELEYPAELLGEIISNSLLSLCQRVLLRRETLKEEYGLDPIIMVPIQLKLFIRGMLQR